jgi:hypothetical protein
LFLNPSSVAKLTTHSKSRQADTPPVSCAEPFFRKGGARRGLVKGKRWLLLSRWMNLSSAKRQELTQLFAMNRKIFKAYLL